LFVIIFVHSYFSYISQGSEETFTVWWNL